MDYHFDQHEKDARDAQRLRQQRDADAVRWLMDSVHGRRIARGIVQSAGLTRDGFTGDAALDAYRAGRRAIALELVDAIRQHAPDQYRHVWENNDD